MIPARMRVSKSQRTCTSPERSNGDRSWRLSADDACRGKCEEESHRLRHPESAALRARRALSRLAAKRSSALTEPRVERSGTGYTAFTYRRRPAPPGSRSMSLHDDRFSCGELGRVPVRTRTPFRRETLTSTTWSSSEHARSRRCGAGAHQDLHGWSVTRSALRESYARNHRSVLIARRVRDLSPRDEWPR